MAEPGGLLLGLQGLNNWNAGQQEQQLRSVQMRVLLQELAQRQQQNQQQQQLQKLFGGALSALAPQGAALQGPAPQQPQQPTPQLPMTPWPLLPQGPQAGNAVAPPQLHQQVLGLEGNQDYAIGKAGELGPGQIKPATGAEYGFKPAQLFGQSGRQASGRIVDDLYQQSGGDAAATLVGYNAGPGAMRKFQASGDRPDSVKLAPAYQSAVLADLTPEQQAQSSQTAIQAAGMMPPQMVGQAQPSMLAQLVQRIAGADAPDEVKGAALMHLLPLMSQDGQRQFQQMYEMLNLQEREQDRALTRQQQAATEKDREADRAAQRELTATIAGARLQQGQQKIDLAKQKFQQAQQGGGPGSVDTVAKGIANYQIAPLTGWTLKGPWGQAVMAKVFQDNPQYQATQFAARQSAARAFASGRQSDTVRRMSVSIAHLATARKLGEALQNTDTPSLNAVKNELQTQFGYEGPVDFNTAKMIVSDEVTSAVAGGALSMTERLGLGQKLSDASSPEQLNGVIDTLTTLLSGQLGGLQRQFETGTGQSGEEFQKKISPQAQEAFKKHPAGGDVTDQLPDAAKAQLKEGQSTTFGNGQVWTLRNGQPQRLQ